MRVARLFLFADWPEKYFWPIRRREFKRFWNWIGLRVLSIMPKFPEISVKT